MSIRNGSTRSRLELNSLINELEYIIGLLEDESDLESILSDLEAQSGTIDAIRERLYQSEKTPL